MNSGLERRDWVCLLNEIQSLDISVLCGYATSDHFEITYMKMQYPEFKIIVGVICPLSNELETN